MHKWINAFLILLIVGMSSSFVFTLNNSPEPQTASRYIVQANNLDQARAFVIEAGGQVTHELGIIHAVGATLSDEQLAAVRARAGVRRVYDDRAVNTSVTASTPSSSACAVSAEQHLSFDYNGVGWKVTNNSGVALHLDRMMVMWPRRSGVLREIEFDQKRVFTGRVRGTTASFDATKLLAQSTHNNDADRLPLASVVTFGIGESLQVRAKFDRTIRREDSYEIRLFFKEGCSVDFPLDPEYAFEGDSDTAAKRTHVASLTGADALHWEGITGKGVGVAIIDTGIWTKGRQSRYMLSGAHGYPRFVIQYDATMDQVRKGRFHSDDNGHGSHVTSVIASSRYKDSEFNGIAPDARLVVIKAFDTDGRGTYLDVIRGLDWVLKYKDMLGIRVLNLSFSAKPQSFYWDDPLNQAVMTAWQNGIVVVTSAGNTGPAPKTIGVPGNLPYVITVGAMTDSVTPLDWSDDTLASFSAAGPTDEGFIKPDVVAPGGHVRGLMGADSKIALKHPHYHDGDAYFTMSGTSQSAAIVSGAVALLLQAEPWLVPDQVKCKLVSTARTAYESNGARAYSVFQQGAGLIDIVAARKGSNYHCANVGLDVTADLVGNAHFQGPAAQDANGTYYLGSMSDHRWDGTADFSRGYLWGGGMAWNDGMPWNDIKVWNDGMPWNDIKVWNDGMPWNDLRKASVSVDIWVKQE